jgi:hypothetical protein
MTITITMSGSKLIWGFILILDEYLQSGINNGEMSHGQKSTHYYWQEQEIE